MGSGTSKSSKSPHPDETIQDEVSLFTVNRENFISGCVNCLSFTAVIGFLCVKQEHFEYGKQIQF